MNSLNSVNDDIITLEDVRELGTLTTLTRRELYDQYDDVREISSNDVPPFENTFVFIGDIEDIHVAKPVSQSVQLRDRILKLCSIASIAVDVENPFRLRCVRRCDIAMTTVKFYIEIFQTDGDLIHIRFYYTYSAYQFFYSTFMMFKKHLINASDEELQNIQRKIVSKDLELLKPDGPSPLLHFEEIISTDIESFSKVHPGIIEPPSLSEVAKLWEQYTRVEPRSLISTLGPRFIISAATGLTLKHTPVPSYFIDFIINSYAESETLQIEVMGFLVAAMTCDPFFDYDSTPDYKLEIHPETLIKISVMIASGKGELFKRHALRFLYAAVIRRPTYDALFCENEMIMSFLNDVSSFLWESNKMFCEAILESCFVC
jgi:hypothetical protein